MWVSFRISAEEKMEELFKKIKSARKRAAFEENWLEMKNEELSKQTFT